MTTAFQPSAFANDAFQIGVPVPVAAGVNSGWWLGRMMPSTYAGEFVMVRWMEGRKKRRKKIRRQIAIEDEELMLLEVT